MSKRSWISLVVVLAAAAALGLFALVSSQTPAVAAKAAGTWREVGVARPQTMTVRRVAVGRYAVRYPALKGAAPWIATLEDGHLTVWGENAISDRRYQIAYDKAHDQLVVTRNGVQTWFRRATR